MLYANAIYLNGNIITVDDHDTRAQAFAVRDGRFVAVGDNGGVLEFRGDKTEVVDLQGQTVIPGLIDAHNHLLSTGRVLRAIPLFGSRSIADVQHKLRERVMTTPKGQWITGRGWDESLFAEGRSPTRHDLDAVAPDHPVVLNRVWNKLVCNSLALKLAGITRETPDPPSDVLYAGRIARDEHGEPIGLFTDRAKRLIESAIPPPSDDELQASIETACRAYNAVGITGVVEPGLLPHEMRAFQRVREREALTVRTRMCVAAWGMAPLDEEAKLKDRIEGMGVKGRDDPTGRLYGDESCVTRVPRAVPEYVGTTQDEWLRVDAIKFMPDGGVGDRTALMYEPYLDEPNNYGQSVIDPEVFYDLVQWAHDLGWSIETHACGDRMIELTVEAYADAKKRNPKPRVRHRIHHAYLPTRRALQLMRESETIAIVQPAFIYNLGESYIKSIGLDRARRMNPYRTYLMNGTPLAGSSDSPVTEFNPWVGLYAAVTHQTVLGTPFDQRENLTIGEALRAFTRGSAYVTFEEDVLGSIEVGKYADFVVIEEDLLIMPIEDVKDVKPTMTVVGGKGMSA